jgi:RsiW-degrading membrane proteinase PrsW (M82 family)
MLIVLRLLWFVAPAAVFFGFAMVYYALTATFRGEYKYTDEDTNRSLASIVFNLLAGAGLLGFESWLFNWLSDWRG